MGVIKPYQNLINEHVNISTFLRRVFRGDSLCRSYDSRIFSSLMHVGVWSSNIIVSCFSCHLWWPWLLLLRHCLHPCALFLPHSPALITHPFFIRLAQLQVDVFLDDTVDCNHICDSFLTFASNWIVDHFFPWCCVQNTLKSCCVWQFGCGGVEIVGVWRTGIEVVKILAQARCMIRRWWGWLRSKWTGSGPRICKECSSRYQWNLAVNFQLILLWLQKKVQKS